jgi:bifunctional N-acetylglucosamine-1-phosphate-uridyltransferase/glucosamine-1-phosphate-acetyltransferase GlmU-like protein
MPEIRGLIAAAGKGSRAGLPYPKTLFPIQGKPILVRILELLAPFDRQPTVVISPGGHDSIESCLRASLQTAHLVIQEKPMGMGNAVLRFFDSPAYKDTEHVILVWGDIPFIQPTTLRGLIETHLAQRNDFTFATRWVDSPYTLVIRDSFHAVQEVQEIRELGIDRPIRGERDIGLFIFRKTPVLDLLRQELPGKYGESTSEHGFLYVIRHLVSRGLAVQGLPIASELDLVSLNSIQDLDGHV